MRRLLLAVMFGAMALPVAAEQLLTQVSSEEVAITSSFAGQTLTLFGTIAPEDLDLFQFAETAEEAWKIIADFYDLNEETAP